MQGAQKLRSEVPEGLAPQGPHKKVEVQRRRWTFYEVIKYHLCLFFITHKQKRGLQEKKIIPGASKRVGAAPLPKEQGRRKSIEGSLAPP
jgi:hypothetical protein